MISRYPIIRVDRSTDDVADSFLDALQTGPPRAGRCSVKKMLSALPEDEREAVVATMQRCKSDAPEDRNFTFSWLAKTLEESGRPTVEVVALRRHMRGECSCG